MTSVSLVITVYHWQQYLAATLDSIYKIDDRIRSVRMPNRTVRLLISNAPYKIDALAACCLS